MINHPLYSRVQKIIAASAANGAIKQTDFNSIRNKASVRAILTDMGYKPNSEVNPYVWRLKGVGGESVSSDRAVSVREKLMNDITAGKTIYVKNINMRKRNISNTISVLRSRGIKVNAIKDMATRKVIGYESEAVSKIKEMPTKIGQEILNDLKHTGYHDVATSPVSYNYLQSIISNARSLGYNITVSKSDRKIVRYVLDKQ